MKGIQSVVTVWMLSLPFLVEAQLAGGSSGQPIASPPKGPGGENGVDPPSPPGSPDIATSTSSSPSSTSILSASTISSTSSKPRFFSTTTNTIAVSSFMNSSPGTSSPAPASTSSVAAGNSALLPASTSSVVAGNSASRSSTSSTTSPVSEKTSSQHRTLIIVLSTVLGFVGLLLIAATLFLAYRFGQGRTPFGHRGASPINDDEIESWRGPVIEQKQKPPSADPAMLNRRANSIALAHSPGWTWTASPTSVRSIMSPSATIPDTPSFLAKAPNSRAGLTDETVPGADPFVPPMKRQSSRLSKGHPGHSRTKSRRSSTSAKSVWSYNGGTGPNIDSKASEKMPAGFDREDYPAGKELGRRERRSSSPETSIFDGVSVGGLSPGPKSQLKMWERDKEIGRAIA